MNIRSVAFRAMSYCIMKPQLRPSLPEDRDFLFRLYASTRVEEIRGFGWNAVQQEAFSACSSMRNNSGTKPPIPLPKTKSLKRTMSQLAA